MLKELNLEQVSVETYKRFIGRGINKQIEALLNYVRNGNIEKLEIHIERFKEIYYSNPLVKTELFPNVVSCLKTLKAAEHSMAICTQKTQEPAEVILRALKIADYFQGFCYGDTLDVMKPDPQMVYSAVQHLVPGPLIYVGDSEVDSETAENSRAIFFLFSKGYRKSPIEVLKAKKVFQDFAELPDLIEESLKHLANKYE